MSMEKRAERKWLRTITSELPEGSSKLVYSGRRYGVTKTVFNQGKSFKVYAEELGGTDFISLNLYLSDKGPLLKPCEMPAAKVRHFLEESIQQ